MYMELGVHYRKAISIRPEFKTLEGTYECNLGYVKMDATAYNLRHSYIIGPTYIFQCQIEDL